jgi:septum formation protein
MEPIILASSSPRRQEILKFLNIPFVVNPANIEEKIPKDIKLDDAAEYLAARKVDAVAKRIPPDQEISWILAADTLIIHKNKVLGKPENQEEAQKFITSLQGQTHKVVTGVALFNGFLHYMTTRTSINKVTFAPMSDEEIKNYVETSEWHGAAGAYRIQGFGSCFIKKIEGTESSVMGLPIFELYDMLKEQNYKFDI